VIPPRPGAATSAARRLALLLLLLLPAGRPAAARPVAGTELPDTVLVDGRSLFLNGTAVYSKFGVRILVAGLWLEHLDRDGGAILRSDLPRRYTTHFLRGVSSKRIRQEWMKGLQANTPEAGAEVRDQFRILCGWIGDFRPGDEITVTYEPGSGSTVEVGGARKGVLTGKAFADAYFACALGPRPRPNAEFKKRLLGG
jgi:hypothetical protein